MNIKLLLLIPFFIILQVDGCSDDEDDTNSGTPDSYVMFQGETNDATGGCNQQVDTGLGVTCNYLGSYQLDGLTYGFGVTNMGFCSSGTYEMSNNFEEDGEASFFIQITADGVPVETFVGSSGSIDLVDSGANSSMSFNGTVVSLDTGVEEPIDGFVQCQL